MLGWTNSLNFWRSSSSPPRLPDSPGSPYFPDNHHIILDPEYADPRTQPGRFDSVYRDSEGNLHPLTYRPFPLLTPPPKKEPRERIAHFDKLKIQRAPVDVEPPYDPWLRLPVDDSPEQEMDGSHPTVIGRWWARLVGNNNANGGEDASILNQEKTLFQSFMEKFYDYFHGSGRPAL